MIPNTNFIPASDADIDTEILVLGIRETDSIVFRVADKDENGIECVAKNGKTIVIANDYLVLPLQEKWFLLSSEPRVVRVEPAFYLGMGLLLRKHPVLLQW